MAGSKSPLSNTQGIVDFDWPKEMIWAPIDFMSFCSERQYPYPRTNWGHYYRPAHYEFAKYIAKSMVDQ
jgi:hypothetical protein